MTTCGCSGATGGGANSPLPGAPPRSIRAPLRRYVSPQVGTAKQQLDAVAMERLSASTAKLENVANKMFFENLKTVTTQLNITSPSWSPLLPP
jgi:hypothetical protein